MQGYNLENVVFKITAILARPQNAKCVLLWTATS